MRSVVTIQANNDERRRWRRRRRRLHNSTKRPKGIKIQTKTHTPHEIATTIIKHAQIHNSMPLPNVYMEAMSVFLSFIVSIEETKKLRFFSCVLCLYLAGIFTLTMNCLVVVGSCRPQCFRWSGDFWWILLSVVSLYSSHSLYFPLIHDTYNSACFFFILLYCLLFLSLFEPNLFAARRKTKKISNLIFRSRCTPKAVFRREYLPGFDGIGLTIVSYFSLAIQF